MTEASGSDGQASAPQPKSKSVGRLALTGSDGQAFAPQPKRKSVGRPALTEASMQDYYGRTEADAARMLGVNIRTIRRRRQELQLGPWPTEGESTLCTLSAAAMGRESSDAVRVVKVGKLNKAQAERKLLTALGGLSQHFTLFKHNGQETWNCSGSHPINPLKVLSDPGFFTMLDKHSYAADLEPAKLSAKYPVSACFLSRLLLGTHTHTLSGSRARSPLLSHTLSRSVGSPSFSFPFSFSTPLCTHEIFNWT